MTLEELIKQRKMKTTSFGSIVTKRKIVLIRNFS